MAKITVTENDGSVREFEEVVNVQIPAPEEVQPEVTTATVDATPVEVTETQTAPESTETV